MANVRQPMSSYPCLIVTMALSHLVFQDTDDVNFYGLKDVLMTSGGHTTMLANGFDFQHAFPISVLE